MPFVYDKSESLLEDVTPEIIREQRPHLFYCKPLPDSMRIMLFHGPRRKDGSRPEAIAGSTDADFLFRR